MANADDREDRVKANTAAEVRKARAKFAKVVEEAANEFYVDTGFVVTAATLQYHIKRPADEIVELRAYALNVDVQMPEDLII